MQRGERERDARRRSAVLMPISRAPTPVDRRRAQRLAVQRAPKNSVQRDDQHDADARRRRGSGREIVDRAERRSIASENAGVREPSAPKNTRPRPVSAKCTPTDTISSTSTDASASGW